MEDYKGIFAQEYSEDGVQYRRHKDTYSRSKGTFSIKVIHRHTMEVVWEGTVQATSCKNAQTQWRKEYSHIRSKYDHSFGLSIKRV